MANQVRSDDFSWSFNAQLTHPGLLEGIAWDFENVYLLLENALTAVRKSDGAQLWKLDLPDHREKHKPAVHDNVQIDRGVLYLCTDAASVIAVNAENGSIIWKQSVNVPGSSFTFSWNPSVAGDRLFLMALFGADKAPRVGYFNSLISLDAPTGSMRWRIEAVPEIVNCSYALESSMRPTVQGDSIFFPTPTGDLYAVDSHTGNRLWAFNADRGDGQDYSLGVPIVDTDGLFFVGCEPLLYCLDPASGSLRWKVDVSHGEEGWSVTETLVKSGHRLFVRTPQCSIICINGASGRVEWCSPKNCGDFYPPIVKDGLIYTSYLQGEGGGLLCLDATTGKEIKRIHLSARIWGLRSDGERLYCVGKHGIGQLNPRILSA